MSGTDDLRGALDRVPVALYRTAPDGSLIAGNQALADLLGYESVDDARAAIANVRSVYVDPDARKSWIGQLESDGVVFDFDIELIRADGSRFWARDSAKVIRNETGDLAFYEGALIDVTDKVRAQKARDEFIATVSHELRNPITVLVGMGAELADNYRTFSDDDRRDMAYLIRRQAEDAAGIIEDLLVASREDPQLQVASVSFDVADEVSRVLEAVDHEVRVVSNGAPSVVQADPHRTRQILRNLVTNAIRYGEDPLQVRIGRQNDLVELWVCDSGAPLSLEDSQRIFEPYQRGSGDPHPKSVGLGLGVARRLAKLMGGDVVYRHDGRWATFVLTLPAHKI